MMNGAQSPGFHRSKVAVQATAANPEESLRCLGCAMPFAVVGASRGLTQTSAPAATPPTAGASRGQLTRGNGKPEYSAAQNQVGGREITTTWPAWDAAARRDHYRR